MSINCLTSSSVSASTTVTSEQSQAVEQTQATVQEVAERTEAAVQTQLHGPSAPRRLSLPTTGMRFVPIDDMEEYMREREEPNAVILDPLRGSFYENIGPGVFLMDIIKSPLKPKQD